MILKSIYFYLFLANAFVLYFTPFSSDLEPFLGIFSIFLFTVIITLLLQSLKRYENDSLESLAKKMIDNGKGMFFISGLTVFDLLIFLLLVPDSSVISLEDSGFSIIFFSLLFLLVPMAFMKLSLESHALKFEGLFWENYKSKINNGLLPSDEFATFIVSRIQYRSTKNQASSNSHFQDLNSSYKDQDDMILTAYPVNTETTDSTDKISSSRNPLFDSEEDLAKENPIEIYAKEIYEIFPELEQYANNKPVNVRPELLLNIIIENLSKDPNLYQLFQKVKI